MVTQGSRELRASPLAEWASVAAKVKESVYTYYAVGVGG